MGRRLNTYVHVRGAVYGPDADVPAEVAEKISNPNVWADSGDREPAQSDKPVEKPAAKPAARRAVKKD